MPQDTAQDRLRVETRIPDGIWMGGPVTCGCGRQMTCIASETLRSSYGERPAIGTRYIYKCGGCPRRLEVRWIERYVGQGEPGPSTGSGQEAA